MGVSETGAYLPNLKFQQCTWLSIAWKSSFPQFSRWKPSNMINSTQKISPNSSPTCRRRPSTPPNMSSSKGAACLAKRPSAEIVTNLPRRRFVSWVKVEDQNKTCQKEGWKYQWEFQDPKMEVLYHIRSYFVGIFPEIKALHRPYIW